MDKSARNDLIAAILILGVAAVFGYATKDVYVSPFDPGFSARDFPIIVISLLTILTVGMAAPALRRVAARGWRLYEKGEARALVAFTLPMAAGAFVYVWLTEHFQYLGPTIVAAAFALAMFGSKSPLRLLLVPIVAGVAYYLLFFGFMGLHETPGRTFAFNSHVYFGAMREALGLQ